MTETMKKRQRAVTLDEARNAVQRLILAAWDGKDLRTHIPARPEDDDVIAADFLLQLTLTDEEKVKIVLPGAKVWRGHHGKVWIATAVGSDEVRELSSIMYLGTAEQRRLDAWRNAAQRLGFVA